MQQGILWLESNANSGLTDPCTTRYLAEMVASLSNVPVLFRNAHSPQEIVYHMRTATPRHSKILNLEHHGEPRKINQHQER